MLMLIIWEKKLRIYVIVDTNKIKHRQIILANNIILVKYIIIRQKFGSNFKKNIAIRNIIQPNSENIYEIFTFATLCFGMLKKL